MSLFSFKSKNKKCSNPKIKNTDHTIQQKPVVGILPNPRQTKQQQQKVQTNPQQTQYYRIPVDGSQEQTEKWLQHIPNQPIPNQQYIQNPQIVQVPRTTTLQVPQYIARQPNNTNNSNNYQFSEHYAPLSDLSTSTNCSFHSHTSNYSTASNGMLTGIQPGARVNTRQILRDSQRRTKLESKSMSSLATERSGRSMSPAPKQRYTKIPTHMNTTIRRDLLTRPKNF